MATDLLKRRSIPSSMIRRAIVAGIVLFAISSLDQAMAGIINGGFESTPSGTWTSGDVTIDGWNMSVISSHSSHQNFSIVPNGGGTEGQKYFSMGGEALFWGDVKLALSTDASFYAPPLSMVSFDYRFSGNNSPSASVKLGNITNHLSSSNDWKHVVLDVPANAEATDLTFTASVATGSGKDGEVGGFILSIDNVQVTPEPSAIALLVFGLGGLPVILWQRWSDRKKNTNG